MTSKEWLRSYHLLALKRAKAYPARLRADAYQEFAITLLGALGEGLSPQVAKYRARRFSGLAVSFADQIVKVPYDLRRKAKSYLGVHKLTFARLDSTSPSGTSYHEILHPPEEAPKKEIPWDVCHEACTPQELAWLRAIDSGEPEMTAAVKAGYQRKSKVRETVGKAIRRYMSDGYIRPRVHKAKEQSNVKR